MASRLASRSVLLIFGVLFICSRPSAAQAYGLENQVTMIPPPSFTPAGPYQFEAAPGFIVPTVNELEQWNAAVNLPNGAIIVEVDVLAYNNDPTVTLTGYAVTSFFPVSGQTSCASQVTTLGSLPATSKFGAITYAGNPFPTALTSLGMCSGAAQYLTYAIAVQLQGTSQELLGARIVWQRQVSPAPGSATFNDVPTSDSAFQFVEALAASGITAGCGGGNYCPDASLTRRQMAVFLAKALGLHWPN
jgi:S-layer homology domain